MEQSIPLDDIHITSWGTPNLISSQYHNEIVKAIREGDVATVKSWLGGSPEDIDRDFSVSNFLHIKDQSRLTCTALMVAAETKQIGTKQLEIIKELLDRGASIDKVVEQVTWMKVTALFMASRNGHVKVVEMLLEHGARLDSEDDAVAAAAEGSHLDVWKLMIAKDPGCLTKTRAGKHLHTPLHAAASWGQVEAVKYLLSTVHNPKYINETDKDGATALNYAAVCGSIEVAKVLLEHKAEYTIDKWNFGAFGVAVNFGNPDFALFLLKNGAKLTPEDFVTVLEQGYERVARAVIETDQWLTVLRYTYEVDGVETTPFRELVGYMPDVAEMVLDHCVVPGKDSNISLHSDPESDDGFCNYNVLYYYEFLEDLKPVVKRDNESIIEQELQTGDDDSIDGKDECPDKSNSQQEPSQTVDSNDSTGKGNTTGDTLNYEEITSDSCTVTSNWPSGTFSKANHPLQIMVNTKKKGSNLLTHPVVLSLIHSKWRVKGRLCYFLNLSVYITYLIFLTTFALIVPNPESSWCQCVSTNALVTGSNVTVSCTQFASGANESMSAIIAVSVFFLLLAFFRLFLELLQLFQPIVRLVYQRNKDWKELIRLLPGYIYNWENWVELAHYSCSIAFGLSVLTADSFCVSNTRWEVGISALFLGWFVFILFASKIPVIGIYVIILLKIGWTVVKLLLLAITLIVAFGLTFFLAFNDFSVVRSPFSNVGLSLLKTMTMTTGEVDFDAIFRFDPAGGSDDLSEIYFPPFSYVIWIVFIVVMPVILTNMLTSLAVGDTNEILEQAHIQRLSAQIDLVLTIEELQLMFGKCLPRCLRRQSQKLYKRVLRPKEYEDSLRKLREFETHVWVGDMERYDRSKAFNKVLEPSKEDVLHQRIEGIEDTVGDMKAILKSPKDEVDIFQKIERIEDTVGGMEEDVRDMKVILKPPEGKAGVVQRIERMEGDVRDMKTILQEISKTLQLHIRAGPSQPTEQVEQSGDVPVESSSLA